jgi:hypothetical protein
MSRGPDAATLLRRVLERHAERCGLSLSWHATESRRWASATFVGACHRMALAIEGAGTDAWIAGLDEVDVPLRGHLVADLIVATVVRTDTGADVGIEVLTVET